jgi:hypothetical protein
MSQGGKKGAKGKWNSSKGDSHSMSFPNGVSMESRVERSRDKKNGCERKGDERRNKEDLSDSDNEQWRTEYDAYSRSEMIRFRSDC